MRVHPPETRLRPGTWHRASVAAATCHERSGSSNPRHPRARRTALGTATVTRLTSLFCSLAWFSLAVAPAWSQPQVTSVSPVTVQRGQDVELHLSGQQLSGPSSLLIYGPGWEVKELSSADPTQVIAKCRISEASPLGTVGLRLACDGGISNLRLVTVSALPVVAEVEPNQGPNNPQSVTFPTTLVGVIDYEDEDVYTFAVEAGKRISLELQGLRLGYEFYDPCLELLDPDGKRLQLADDSNLTRQDPWLSVTAPQTGNYTVRVRERTYGGSGQSRYALHLGSFPRPGQAFPGGGQGGQTVPLTWQSPEGPVERSVALPPDVAGEWPWFPEDDQGVSPTPLSLHVSKHPSTAEVEPNQERTQATPCQAPVVVYGTLDPPGDRDLFQFHAVPGQVWMIRSVARTILRSPLDSIVRVHQPDGPTLLGNDDSANADSVIEFSVPAEGDYVLEIEDHLGHGGSEFAYRVEIFPREPGLVLRAPERAYNTPVTVPVAQGNRMALMVAVERQYLDAPVELQWSGLPAGVAVEAPAIPQGTDRAPVLLQAAADAPLAGALASLTGGAVVDSSPITGTLRQRTMLAIGMNNRDMWGHDATQLACAVVKGAPFRLEWDPPAAPIVRNGEKPLKFRLVRQEGFAEPVHVQMLYNPPGISSPGDVLVPGDQSEGTMPITANGASALGIWPVLLMAQTSFQGTRFEVASGLVPLIVEDYPFDVAFDKASLEQGGNATLGLHVTRRQPEVKEARVELVGLPPGVTAQPLDLAADQTDLQFAITAAPDARPGRYPSVLARVTQTRAGEPVVQTVGTGQVRVDPPSAPAAPPMPEATP